MMDRREVITHKDCSNCMDCLIMFKAGQKKPKEYVVIFGCTKAQLHKFVSMILFFHLSYPVTSIEDAKNSDSSTHAVLRELSEQHF